MGRGVRLEDVSLGNLCCLLELKGLRWVEGEDSKMYLEETCVTLLNCKAFGGSHGLRTRRCHLEETCVVYLLVSPSVGRGLRLEDVSSGNV